MSINKYAEHIPYLRRFARALTGSQQDGDLYVRTTLQIIIAEDHKRVSDLSPKLELYRSFIKVWTQTGSGLEPDAANDSNAAARVRRLAPLERQAFVLSALESMTETEIGKVMNITVAMAIELLATAEVDITNGLRANVLIIEDEPIIAGDIEGIVQELGHSVCGIAATHEAAVALISRTNPGIILSDVNLADGSSGIDAVSHILKTHTLPIIFITAFPEQLLTGDKPEPAYLISKPFEPENLKAAISQALFFHDQ